MVVVAIVVVVVVVVIIIADFSSAVKNVQNLSEEEKERQTDR